MLNDAQTKLLVSLRKKGETWEQISHHFKQESANSLRKAYYRHIRKPQVKVLLIDIETKPIEAQVWDLWQQNVGLNQIAVDSSVLSWSAKWLEDGDDKVMYQDNRGAKDLSDDKNLLKGIWELLDEADVVIGHYSEQFDVPKLNARFIKHGFKKPSSFRQIDTKKISSAKFKFTSNKLEYLASYLNVKYKKLSHGKFPGHTMWSECMKGNKDAWDEMKTYNIHDVLVLQEVYYKLRSWDTTINFNVYHDDDGHICSCGSTDFKEHKTFHYTNAGKFYKYICVECGAETRGKENLLAWSKRKQLRKA